MSNKEQVADYIQAECEKVSFTLEGIAALFGQIEKESHFIVNNVQDGMGWSDEDYTRAVDTGTYTKFATDEIGYGLYQLTEKSRKTSYLEFTRNRGVSIGNLENMVAFMLWELYKKFPGIWRKLQTSHDLNALTKTLLYEWENPQEKAQNLADRIQYANEWYQKLKQKGGGSMTSTTVNQNGSVNAAAEKVLALAASEVDYHEKASGAGLDDKYANSGSGNWTKYARDLDEIQSFYNGKKQGAAWCDVFVDWLFVKCFGAATAMKMLCQPQNSAGAGCKYSKDYYQAAGRFSRNPAPGSQIFFYDTAGQINHTGIVEKVVGGMVHTIEGNTMDRVARMSYSIDDGRIAGYGAPIWELAITSSVPATPAVNVNIDMNIVNNMFLRLGDKNGYVANMQNRLIELGYDVGPDGADGDFGMDTLAALKQFQYDHNLPECGYFGPATFAAMKPAQTQTTPTPTQPPMPGMPHSGTGFKIGNFVNFTGTKQYMSPVATNPKPATPGKARVVTVQSDKPHPYYLAHATNGGSNVFGWVDATDVEEL